jgi:hypothetical protein
MGVSDRSTPSASLAAKRSYGPAQLGLIALAKNLPMYISDRALPEESETISEIEVRQEALEVHMLRVVSRLTLSSMHAEEDDNSKYTTQQL